MPFITLNLNGFPQIFYWKKDDIPSDIPENRTLTVSNNKMHFKTSKAQSVCVCYHHSKQEIIAVDRNMSNIKDIAIALGYDFSDPNNHVSLCYVTNASYTPPKKTYNKRQYMEKEPSTKRKRKEEYVRINDKYQYIPGIPNLYHDAIMRNLKKGVVIF